MEDNEFTYTIRDKRGLHVRPVCKIVKAAKQYKDTLVYIELVPNGYPVCANSVLDLLSLHAKCGDTLEVSTDGLEAEGVLEIMREIFEENL